MFNLFTVTSFTLSSGDCGSSYSVVSVVSADMARLTTVCTRSSADADNGLDAFVGQSRSTNISGPFQVK